MAPDDWLPRTPSSTPTTPPRSSAPAARREREERRARARRGRGASRRPPPRAAARAEHAPSAGRPAAAGAGRTSSPPRRSDARREPRRRPGTPARLAPRAAPAEPAARARCSPPLRPAAWFLVAARSSRSTATARARSSSRSRRAPASARSATSSTSAGVVSSSTLVPGPRHARRQALRALPGQLHARRRHELRRRDRRPLDPAGQAHDHASTIPEGLSRAQIAPLLEDAGVSGDYLRRLGSLTELSTRPSTAPRTPRTSRASSSRPPTSCPPRARARQLVERQLDAFKQRFAGVDISYARSKNLTAFDVLIIASMIEREVQIPEERELVAAVIYNRLSRTSRSGSTRRSASPSTTTPSR